MWTGKDPGSKLSAGMCLSTGPLIHKEILKHKWPRKCCVRSDSGVAPFPLCLWLSSRSPRTQLTAFSVSSFIISCCEKSQTIFSPGRYCVCTLAGLAFPGILSCCLVAPRFPALLSSRGNKGSKLSLVCVLHWSQPTHWDFSHNPKNNNSELYSALVFSLIQWMNRELFTTQAVPHHPLNHRIVAPTVTAAF